MTCRPVRFTAAAEQTSCPPLPLMLGREAYHRPMLLSDVSAGGGAVPDRMAMLERMTAFLHALRSA